MSFDRSASPLTIRMDILVKDGVSGDVFRDKDYVITIDTGNDPGFGDYVEVTISGRFYSPRTGYVDIDTTVPIRTYISERWPSICEMTVTAVNRDGDEATARLVALNAKGYMVVIDLGYAKQTFTANWEGL